MFKHAVTPTTAAAPTTSVFFAVLAAKMVAPAATTMFVPFFAVMVATMTAV
jgi:hypothetical protein